MWLLGSYFDFAPVVEGGHLGVVVGSSATAFFELILHLDQVVEVGAWRLLNHHGTLSNLVLAPDQFAQVAYTGAVLAL